MKVFITTTLIFLSYCVSSGQSVIRQSIGSMASSHSNSAYSLQSCVGQAYATQSILSIQSDYRPGFIQPIVKIKSIDVKQISLHVYPNPTTDVLYVNCSNLQRRLRIEVLSLMGQVLVKQTISQSGTNSVSCTDLSSGIYLVRLVDDTQVYGQAKFIKK